MTEIELSLGSNTRAEHHMARAKELLESLLPGIAFGREEWTQPVPTPAVPHPTRPYLNCLARARTTLTQAALTAKLKQLERTLGDAPGDHRQGTVRIDIDLLAYGPRRLRHPAWLTSLVIALLLLLTLPLRAQQPRGDDGELLGRALDYVAGSKWGEALTILDRLDARYKLNARYRAYLGLCLYHEWDYRRAATVLGEALPQLSALAPHERSVYLYAAAESHFQLAAYDSARVYFEADLALCYDNERGDVLYRIGLCHMQQGHWAEAAAAYAEADRWLAAQRTGSDVAARRAQLAHMRDGCLARLDTIYIQEERRAHGRERWRATVARAVIAYQRQQTSGAASPSPSAP